MDGIALPFEPYKREEEGTYLHIEPAEEHSRIVSRDSTSNWLAKNQRRSDYERGYGICN